MSWTTVAGTEFILGRGGENFTAKENGDSITSSEACLVFLQCRNSRKSLREKLPSVGPTTFDLGIQYTSV